MKSEIKIPIFTIKKRKNRRIKSEKKENTEMTNSNSNYKMVELEYFNEIYDELIDDKKCLYLIEAENWNDNELNIRIETLNWSREINEKIGNSDSTWFTAVEIFDKFVNKITYEIKVQLSILFEGDNPKKIMLCALKIAQKYNEISVLPINKIIEKASIQMEKSEFLTLEYTILKYVDFKIDINNILDTVTMVSLKLKNVNMEILKNATRVFVTYIGNKLLNYSTFTLISLMIIHISTDYNIIYLFKELFDTDLRDISKIEEIYNSIDYLKEKLSLK